MKGTRPKEANPLPRPRKMDAAALSHGYRARIRRSANRNALGHRLRDHLPHRSSAQRRPGTEETAALPVPNRDPGTRSHPHGEERPQPRVQAPTPGRFPAAPPIAARRGLSARSAAPRGGAGSGRPAGPQGAARAPSPEAGRGFGVEVGVGGGMRLRGGLGDDSCIAR